MPQPKFKGPLPAVGSPAPELRFVQQDKSDSALKDLFGEVVILCMFPSLDTSTCALQTRIFNERAAGMGLKVLAVTVDLPFAMKRFCAVEGIANVATGSDFRFHDAGDRWGARIVDGNMNGTLGRITWVIDRSGVIRFVDIPEGLSDEPDYKSVLSAAKDLL